ncbi:patatin-like phospholipase family protein [Corallococcus llansteffanensis]|uniref:Patatin-like phospholipase family protein n=1 Tax=Corallococcus llansteffanensis TaxID=2316731 RepID=A0A3A8P375_9BACT|nr:patatin-like phospholipase family protein [Corallococcus llansteffanensis]
MSLSGGGYRAATFHLGTLRFLHGMGLLPDVVGLSTVSGGTLTGLAWVVSQLDGKPFTEFHDTYAGWLKGTNVIAEALTGLTSDREHQSHTWASLIRSAADVYSRRSFLDDRRFGEVLDASGLQFQELIFNATEFHTGSDFRFRRSDRPDVRPGNKNTPLPRSVARHVRLADVAAASSCFPGGFEPLVFPQQFHWPREFPLDAALQELGPEFTQGLPLMDGGIYDNQGVDSLLLAFDDARLAPTLVISDVSTKEKRIYDVPPNPTKRGWVTLNGVSWMAWGLFFLTLASALCLGWRAVDDALDGGWELGDAFVYIVPGLLSAAVAVALVWARLRLQDVNALLRKQVDIDAWPSFRKLTVLEFAQMLVLRVTSSLALTSSIFMKRVRGLIYDSVSQDPDFQGRQVPTLIYTLTEDHAPLYSKHPWMKPGPRLVALAGQACQMPTTLWFTNETQFTTLESAGEATLCFVLLRHLLQLPPDQYEKEGQPLHDLFQRLRAAWAGFNPEALPARAQHPVAA